MATATVIVDLQFGSTGKGLLAGYLATRDKTITAAVTAWAPNAGHTFVTADGRRFVRTQLAIAASVPHVRAIFIGPGSVIDPQALRKEIEDTPGGLTDKAVLIHECAAVVKPEHVSAEDALLAIGSTQKGSGAALIDKIRRRGDAIARRALPPGPWTLTDDFAYQELLAEHEHVLVEGHQGHSLSIHSSMYPYVTSRDTSVHAILSDCAIPRTRELAVWGSLRTYPIRVSNRFDGDGAMVGTSGPPYQDQHELSWSDLGVQAELTTVTKRERRVFSFSRSQVREAIALNAPDRLFINFMNYIRRPASRWDFVQQVCTLYGDPEAYTTWLYGYGPKDTDVFTAYHEWND